MPRKRLLEAGSAQDRAAQRRKLGTLRELTVQPATKRRYTIATDKFFAFLRSEGQVLPRAKVQLDELLCDYLEHLWSSGAGRGQASDTIAGLQDIQPNLRHNLPGAWRLLKTWHINEIPNRAPPLPEHVVLALAGWAFFKEHQTFAISLLVGFYSMLRTGELLALRSSHMMSSPHQAQVLISLGLTKGGKRLGAAESVVLGVTSAVKLVKAWKSVSANTQPLATCPARWRALFNEGLAALQLSEFGFRPYSLRRGGATWWFSKHQSMDRLLVQGRWHTQKSARIYINEGLAMLAGMRFPASDRRIRPFLQVINQTLAHPNFQPLEPPPSGGRPGGRGRRRQKTKKHSSKRPKKRFICNVGSTY